MPQPVFHIDSSKAITRVIAVLALVASIAWSVLFVRWYIGNTLAEYLNPDASSVDLLSMAVTLAPDDPLTHWRLAEFAEKKLPIDQIGAAVLEYEVAVALSPFDYRYWMALGRALEQSGDIQRAEAALRRAVELAPYYSYPRWYLGNLLLRNERYDEAFAELRLAGDADPELRPQLFNLAWEVFKGDTPSLQSAVGTTAAARAQFSLYSIGRGRIDDGLRLWFTLSEDERRENLSTAQAVIDSLVNNGKHHHAATVWNGVASQPSYQVAIGKILDGGFEDGSYSNASVFGWKIKSHPQAQIGIDRNNYREGRRSLRLVFQVGTNLTAFSITQLVPVQPKTQYIFRTFVKTQRLQSAATPMLSILDPATNRSIGDSSPAPTGDNDWQPVTVVFETGPDTEAIRLMVQRASCGENEVCPMFGTVWYDDFNLKTGS
ncbi:MAG TPA: tetratricopeptide repeat protein [Pyrinomonadaceae bacterium]|nr:tetratricopeptide repeat protein [Pyrinomonadaceae bacterium]